MRYVTATVIAVILAGVCVFIAATLHKASVAENRTYTILTPHGNITGLQRTDIKSGFAEYTGASGQVYQVFGAHIAVRKPNRLDK